MNPFLSAGTRWTPVAAAAEILPCCGSNAWAAELALAAPSRMKITSSSLRCRVGRASRRRMAGGLRQPPSHRTAEGQGRDGDIARLVLNRTERTMSADEAQKSPSPKVIKI